MATELISFILGDIYFIPWVKDFPKKELKTYIVPPYQCPCPQQHASSSFYSNGIVLSFREVAFCALLNDIKLVRNPYTTAILSKSKCIRKTLRGRKKITRGCHCCPPWQTDHPGKKSLHWERGGSLEICVLLQ